MARYWVRLTGFSRETMFCVATCLGTGESSQGLHRETMFCLYTWLGTGEGSQVLNRETRLCLYTWLCTVEGSNGSTERLGSVYIHG